jgi:3-dehydroquinate synthase
MGVALDTMYSSLVHGLPESDALATLDCLVRLGLPITHPLLCAADAVFDGLEQFRQHLGGRLTLTMLPQVGTKLDVHAIDRVAMTQAARRVAEYAVEIGAVEAPDEREVTRPSRRCRSTSR